MKFIVSLLSMTFIFVFLLAPTTNVAALDPVGKITISGGAEKAEGNPAGGRGTIELLGLLPIGANFGLQGIGHYVGGQGSRIGFSLGPIVGWNSGKAGLFVNYQHRSLHSNNFVSLRPSVAFYLDQANLNLWYSHPVSSPQRSRTEVEYGINWLQGTLSYFPATDVASFMRKDNLELTLGLQVNTFAGAGRHNLDSAGVGPVFGFSFMPIQNLAVNLFKATFDNRSRYTVESGIQYHFFGPGNSTLKELRRRSLEPNWLAPGAGGRINRRQPPPPSSSSSGG